VSPGGRQTRLGTACLFAFGTLVGGAFAGTSGRLACDENVYPGTSRETVCNIVGNDSASLLLALVPPLLVALAALAVSFRATATCTALILAAEAVIFALVLTTAS
jgi:hypothetical protein